MMTGTLSSIDGSGKVHYSELLVSMPRSYQQNSGTASGNDLEIMRKDHPDLDIGNFLWDAKVTAKFEFGVLVQGKIRTPLLDLEGVANFQSVTLVGWHEGDLFLLGENLSSNSDERIYNREYSGTAKIVESGWGGILRNSRAGGKIRNS